MASKPYPSDSAYCSAKLDGLITPYVDNRPRPDMTYREVVYCDLPRSHAFSPTVGRRWHKCEATAASMKRHVISNSDQCDEWGRTVC